MSVRIQIWDIYPSRTKDMEEHFKRIRPIIRVKGIPHFVPKCDSFDYYFDIEKIGPEAQFLSLSREIKTYHYRSRSTFSPRAAEVIAQIPEDLFDIVNAFEIVNTPKNLTEMLQEPEAFLLGYHTATTRLYAGVQPVVWRDKLYRLIDKYFGPKHDRRVSEARDKSEVL